MKYYQLHQESKLPDIKKLNPFKAIVIIEKQVTTEWQTLVSKWLVNSGCLYMMAWGLKCSLWDDSVDYANIDAYNNKEIPSNKLVITTWHENEALEEVFWYSKNNAVHSEVDILNTIIIHISSENKNEVYTNAYNRA